MLLHGFHKQIFRAECNHEFESLHCFAHLDQDVGEVIPYLNAELGGWQFIADPPSVTFRVHGKLITVHSRKIAVNALRDEDEADRILNWLKNEINEIWDRRGEITPLFKSAEKPQIIEILKLLPKTNCRKCGLPTCMVFAVQAAEGGKEPENCPELSAEKRMMLTEYLTAFDRE